MGAFDLFTLITTLIARAGLKGVFLLMLLENLAPFIPSELILPLAGFQVSRGQFSYAAAVVFAALGSAAGGAAWYAVGRGIGAARLEAFSARHGRWIGISPQEVRAADGWFKKRGGPAVLIGRALPGVRAVICIPAGMARMPVLPFLAWSTAGAAIWAALLIAAGGVLGSHYRDISQWLDPVVDGVVLLGIGLYLWRVARFRRADL